MVEANRLTCCRVSIRFKVLVVIRTFYTRRLFIRDENVIREDSLGFRIN